MRRNEWEEQARWRDSIQRPQVPRILKSTLEQSTSRELLYRIKDLIQLPAFLSRYPRKPGPMPDPPARTYCQLGPFRSTNTHIGVGHRETLSALFASPLQQRSVSQRVGIPSGLGDDVARLAQSGQMRSLM